MTIRKILLGLGIPFLAGSIAFSSCEKKDPKLEQIIDFLGVRNHQIQLVQNIEQYDYITHINVNDDFNFSYLDNLVDKQVDRYDGDIKTAVEKVFYALTGKKLPKQLSIEILDDWQYEKRFKEVYGEEHTTSSGFVYDRKLKYDCIYDENRKLIATPIVLKPKICIRKGPLFYDILPTIMHEIGQAYCPADLLLYREMGAHSFEYATIDLVTRTSDEFYKKFIGEIPENKKETRYKLLCFLTGYGDDDLHRQAGVTVLPLGIRLGFDKVYEIVSNPEVAAEYKDVMKKELKRTRELCNIH